MALSELSVAFFLQVFVIVAACRAMGWIMKRFFDQPQVIGEMIAGVILGPSLLGLLAPDVQAMIFPKDAKPVLYVCAQLGVGLYMFLVGLGFRTDHFRLNARSAVAVSVSGMAAPFLVAVALTPWLLNLDLFGKGITSVQATLFMGACISITAFPVLARIIQERGLTKTPLGSLALSAGAIDDAGAWTVLAIVLASFGGGPEVAIKAIVGGGLFAAFMIVLGPKLLAPLARWAEREGKVTPQILAVAVMLFGLSAWAMDAAGLHSVFGGFLLGVAMPRGLLTREIRKQVEPFTTALLVPMFFAFSGLNTQLTMVNSLNLAAIATVILVGSVAAKGLACWAAARVTGQDNATAMAVGTLMNARGLMELIIINIGLQKGIIGPALFSMLVVMAIVTTLMASPLFELVYGRKARASGELGQLNEADDNEDIVAAPAKGLA
ncbi:cation:proton antiporter [Sphingomonas aurantiaca]|uniref:Transporter (CPA2 family) n=1 Tax=Sphingomonas aurantiaca TaxID=185949 RepID=A0A2T5GH72_9SPHN|nr:MULTISPECIES: cation:proton antiporter [Sphingomonas]KQN08123.1 potassium transporter [Sphingomonas sp. Leaf28]PTQ58669.1 transporter (CPA2 family) [Sphingomonas aurantiaca]